MNQEQKARRLLADIGLNYDHLTSAEFLGVLKQEFPNDMWTSQFVIFILRTSGLTFHEGQYYFKPPSVDNTAKQKRSLQNLTAKDACAIGVNLYKQETVVGPITVSSNWWVQRCAELGFNPELPIEDSGWSIKEDGNLIWCPPDWRYSKTSNKFVNISTISPQYAINIIKKDFSEVRVVDLITNSEKSYQFTQLSFLVDRALYAYSNINF